MFAIFRQTYKKLLFTPSTFVFIFLVGFIFKVSMSFDHRLNSIVWATEAVAALFRTIIFQYSKLFVWFILPPFVAIKSAGFIADELEDGTFLTVLSKPISRSRILIEKFLALTFVNITFIVSASFLMWWFALKTLPYKIATDFFLTSIGTMLLIPIIMSIIISILLVVLSLKLKTSFITGIGIGIGFFSFISPNLINKLVIKNNNYQNSIGQEISENAYNKVNASQNRYSKFRYLNYTQHANQIYFSNIAKVLKQYNLDAIARSSINKRIIFEPFEKVIKNKIGEDVTKIEYKTASSEYWVPTSTIYTIYAILTMLTLMIGFLYFKRKDIV